MATDNYLQMMIDSLGMKIDILQKIVKLNKEQAVMVDAGNNKFDEQRFYSNIEEKGDLIENLLKLDDGFDALFQRVKEILEKDKPKYSEQIKTMQQLIKTATELSVEVQAQEVRNKVAVEKKFREMKQDIQNARRSTKMANTYYKSQNKFDYQPQFMDQKK